MIGFNYLGKLGRLGNQMFQYAALKGIAANRGYDICIPVSNIEKNKDEWSEHQLNKVFKMSTMTSSNYRYIDFNFPTIYENSFSFDEELFNSCPDSVSIQGYFQTEKYFKHIRNELLIDFQFQDYIVNPVKEIISNWKSPISLHVRRTDYITNPNHNTLSIEYYKESLKQFDDDREVIIFSDDPKWCLQQEIFNNDRFMVSENNDSYFDLCLMTFCSGHIIANSSFSWWGAWISNSSEKIIAPSGWFTGSNNEHLNTKDIVPENWMLI